MINKSAEVLEALSEIPGVAEVFRQYPDSFARLPCVSFGQMNNSPAASADDAEYLSELMYKIDVWGAEWDSVNDAACEIDAAMTEIGFTRDFCGDVDDPDSDVLYVTMRYKFIG